MRMVQFVLIVCGILGAALVEACAQPTPSTSTPVPTKPSVVQPTATSLQTPSPKATTPAVPPQPTPAAAAKPAAAPGQAAVKPLDPPVAVKMGFAKLYVGAPVIIAKEKGYFEQEGLIVDLVEFAVAGQMTTPVIVGDLDVGFPSYSPGLFNAIQRAVGLRVVASNSSYSPGHGTIVNVRKDMAAAIKDVTDLKGRRVGIPTSPGGNDIVFDKAFKKAGIKKEDVTFVVLSAADQNVAFGNKAIDVGFQSEPQAALGIAKGLSVPWKTASNFYPDMEITGYVYSEKFMKNRPEAAKRLMVALLRGVRDYHEAFINNRGNRKELLPLMNKVVKLDDDSMYDTIRMPFLNPDGYVNKKLLADDIKWYFDRSMIEANLNVDSLIDDQFLDYAIGRLGRYK